MELHCIKLIVTLISFLAQYPRGASSLAGVQLRLSAAGTAQQSNAYHRGLDPSTSKIRPGKQRNDRDLLAVVVTAQSSDGEGSSARQPQGASCARTGRCVGTVGSWCGTYYSQEPVLCRVPPIGVRQCPGGCGGAGVCDADTGRCDCAAGWGGPNCADPLKRPCTKGYRTPRNSTVPNSHIGVDGRDLDWSAAGSTYSRCAGVCDDDVAACYCDPKLGNPKHGRVPAPPGSPPGTPPLREGRQLFDPCSKLMDDGRGNALSWIKWGVAYDRIYGPGGWCVADEPQIPECRCDLDGSGGPGCNIRSEMFCLNQCSGRGRCLLGFCLCDEGWYGVDCAHAASEAAARSPRRPPPPPWTAELAVDAWRCAGYSEGCGDEAIRRVEGGRGAAAGAGSNRGGAGGGRGEGEVDDGAVWGDASDGASAAKEWPRGRPAAEGSGGGGGGGSVGGGSSGAGGGAFLSFVDSWTAGDGAGGGAPASASAAAPSRGAGGAPAPAGGEGGPEGPEAEAGGGTGHGAAKAAGKRGQDVADAFDVDLDTRHRPRPEMPAASEGGEDERGGGSGGGGSSAPKNGGGSSENSKNSSSRGSSSIESSERSSSSRGGSSGTSTGRKGPARPAGSHDPRPAATDPAGVSKLRRLRWQEPREGPPDPPGPDAALGGPDKARRERAGDRRLLGSPRGANDPALGAAAGAYVPGPGAPGAAAAVPRPRPASPPCGKSAGTVGGSVPKLRPLIYIYNVPSIYVGRMLQYRMYKEFCSWRLFDAEYDNSTLMSPYPYASEPLLLELLLQSRHRTLDPEEADFFYVPVMSTCWFSPVSGWADYPWWYVDTWSRVSHAAVMTNELLNWVRTEHPYWNRTGGADHIWTFAHDEGACWAPTEVYKNSVILTHWGRLDRDHRSGTSYGQDNYTSDVMDDPFMPQGYTHLIKGHPCYTPGKDLVIPLFRGPDRYHASPYLGGPPRERDILLFHRGRMGEKDTPGFSRGVRQRIAKASKAGNWSGRYNIHVGGYDDITGDYSELLSRSTFCLVAAGDGWSARFDDAMLHGCIPVIILDRVVGPWGHQLQWQAFSIRIPEADAEKLPDIISSIPHKRVRRMQRAMAAVWHRFVWLSHPVLHRMARDQIAANEAKRAAGAKNGSKVTSAAGVGGGGGGAAQRRAPPWLRVLQPGQWEDDAFNTILQWLHHKLQQRLARAGAGGARAGGGGGARAGVAATGSPVPESGSAGTSRGHIPGGCNTGSLWDSDVFNDAEIPLPYSARRRHHRRRRRGGAGQVAGAPSGVVF